MYSMENCGGKVLDWNLLEKASVQALADWDGSSMPWAIASGASGKYVSFEAVISETAYSIPKSYAIN